MSVWFVIPAHGRYEVTRVCLRLLAETCAELTDNGLEATAVVIADDENLDTASDLGFATVRQTNEFLGRKWNDGYQLATDPRYNPRPADHVIPFGSDDWIDPQLVLRAPLDDQRIVCFKQAAFVNETGTELATLTVPFQAGVGIRIIPRQLVAAAGHRPAEEDQRQGLDTSTLVRLRRHSSVRLAHFDLHDLQIVDWKTRGGNLHTYAWYTRYHRGGRNPSPYQALQGVYPGWALDAMREVYA